MTRITQPLALLSLLAACSTQRPEPVDTTGEARAADGVLISYEVSGAGEPALVLVHGWANDRRIWGEHPRTLARTNRVVAIDLAGHGVSGSDRAMWTMEALGGDVARVVEQLDLEQVVLVGFSMGGAVVLEAAEQMPDRTVGVVLVDAFHDPSQVPPPEAVDQLVSQFRASWGDTAFLRAFAFTPDAPDSLIQYLKSTLPAEPREHWFPILRALIDWTRTDFAPTLQNISAPVAAINTTREPTNVDAIRRYAPSFTLDTIGGVGHAGILLQRVEDFDSRLLAIVERFASMERRPD